MGDYYIKALEECRLNMSKCIVESRRVPGHVEKPTREMLKALPPKEYLYRTVIPALLPALEQCQRIRPPDPIEFIAFYMLRHPGVQQDDPTLRVLGCRLQLLLGVH